MIIRLFPFFTFQKTPTIRRRHRSFNHLPSPWEADRFSGCSRNSRLKISLKSSSFLDSYSRMRQLFPSDNLSIFVSLDFSMSRSEKKKNDASCVPFVFPFSIRFARGVDASCFQLKERRIKYKTLSQLFHFLILSLFFPFLAIYFDPLVVVFLVFRPFGLSAEILTICDVLAMKRGIFLSRMNSLKGSGGIF